MRAVYLRLEGRSWGVAVGDGGRREEVQGQVKGRESLANGGRWRSLLCRGRGEGGDGRNGTRGRLVVNGGGLHRTLLGQLGGRSEDLDELVVIVMVVGPDVPCVCIQRLIRPRVDRRPKEPARRAASRSRRLRLHLPVMIISILQELDQNMIII